MLTHERIKELVTDHSLHCVNRDIKEDRSTMTELEKDKMDVIALRLLQGLCPVCGKTPAYNEAFYCGAACAAMDGA
jgi:DNA repair exonuclease SbcCD ATPase subunit